MNSAQNAGSSRQGMKRLGALLLLLALSLATATSALAQKKKKKDESQPTPPPSVAAAVPDEQKIDYVIGEMLGAWQLGDIEKLHKNLADDISVVSGMWSPPTVGWANYLAAYQAQRARMYQVRMDRDNTLIRVAPSGTFAWACYQWDFSAVVDGSPSAARGQTTLVLEKRGDAWVIVHNHTSLVQPSPSSAPASSPPPGVQPSPTKP